MPNPFLDIPPMASAQGTLRLPGSKSLSNRALLLAALAKGHTRLHGLLDADDTRVMLNALQTLGVTIRQAEQGVYTIEGVGGAFPVRQASLFLGNAGTAFRPLSAALAMMQGNYHLHGVPRMHERPIGDLLQALRSLGAQVQCLGTPDYPPLQIGAFKPQALQTVSISGQVSSQFLSALLMAAPLWTQGTGQPLRIQVEGSLISQPYVRMTLAMMAQFGVQVEETLDGDFIVPAQAYYQGVGDYFIEGDASSASYFMALGLLGGGPVRIEGLRPDSLQGDVRFSQVLANMGAQLHWLPNALTVSSTAQPYVKAIKAFDIDCSDIPDAAMTAAVLALFADGPCTLRNIGSWRVKETDRIQAMYAELQKLGAQLTAGEDYLCITPPLRWQAANIHTYDDHRMAMCLSLASFGGVGVRIHDPNCVAKTFPDYFQRFSQLCRPHQAEWVAPLITIDGPSASGKGTVSRLVAQALGWQVLDSGSLYRLLALAVLQTQTSPEDEAAVLALVPGLDLSDSANPALRDEHVGKVASQVATYPAVRAALLDKQRQQAQQGLVADGRDMGTVVFPMAPLKVFLQADVHERARRRHVQLGGESQAQFDAILADLKARDRQDSERKVAPLKPAPGALVIDSTHLQAHEVVDRILRAWQCLALLPTENRLL